MLAKAQQRAADESLVRRALPKLAGVETATAALLSLGEYPSSLNAARLQRVAGLMRSTGMLAAPLDVRSLLPADS